MEFLPALAQYIQTREAELSALSAERRNLLAPLISYVTGRRQARRPILLNFICTHNSRRSHLGQIWGAVAAARYGIAEVSTYSGGTEATAFNPRAVAAIQRAGLETTASDGTNPKYLIHYSRQAPPLLCFSKVYDDPDNPREEFAAVMTCTDADQNCPALVGATRISLPYRDPKEADGTALEKARYDERTAQIATEMLFAFSEVARQAAL